MRGIYKSVTAGWTLDYDGDGAQGRARRGGGSLKVRSHLVLLVLVALLPVIAFATAIIALVSRNQQESVQRGLLDTVRALSAAVDAEVNGAVIMLDTLAASHALRTGDLARFYQEAERVRAEQPRWSSIALADPSGRQVFNLLRPFGTSLPPVPSPETAERAVGTRRASVSDFVIGPVGGLPIVVVHVPVMRGGEVAYVLVTSMRLAMLSGLLAAQKMPPDWSGTILDRQGVVIAASRAAGTLVGKPVTTGLARHAREAEEGVFADVAHEGVPAYGAFSRSRVSGWTVVLSIPAASVDLPRRRVLATLIGGAVAFLLLSTGLALVVGRRIAGAISSLSAEAVAMGRGEPLPVSRSSPVTEVNAVRHAVREVIAERRRAEETARMLAETTHELALVQPVKTLLGKIAETCARLLHCASVGVRIVEGDEVVPAGGVYGEAAEIMSRRRLKIGESLSGEVAATGAPLIVNDVQDDPRVIPAHREAMARAGYTSWLGVPVKIGERVIGVLTLHGRSTRRFTDADLPMATAFAAEAAIALENARLYAETQRRRETAEQLAEIGRLITQSLEFESVGRKIVEGVRALLGTRTSVLYLLDPASGDLRAHATAGEVGPLTYLPAGTGLAGLAVRERRTVTTGNIAIDPRVTLPTDGRETLERSGIRCGLAVPLLVQDAVIGVLAVGDAEGRIFGYDDARLAEAFGDQAVVALHNARLYEATQQQLTRTQTLLAIAQTVGATLDLTEMLRRVAREVRQAVAADMAGAYLADADERLLHPIAASRVPKRLLEAFREHVMPLAGHAFIEEAWQRRQTVWSDDAEQDPRVDRDVSAQFPQRSIAFVPMVVKERPLGGLFLIWWGRRPPLTADEVALAEGIARQAAIAVGNASLYEKARRTLEELEHAQERLVQAQKMEAIGRLAGGIAHDFNNMLVVILGRSDLLLQRLPPSSPLRRHAELVQNTARRAAALTAQLLAFSRKQVIQPRVLRLDEAVEEMLPILQRLVREDIELTFAPHARGMRVQVDPGQLQQVLLNLVVNARDAMPEGGRLVIATGDAELKPKTPGLRIGVPPGRYVTLAVSDSGTGMDAETLGRLFEPFFTTKPAGAGTGLGLSTVHGIVAQSGGDIAVDSEQGRGTTVTIYLPRVETDAPPGDDSGAAATGGTETILLVEDQDEVRGLTREVLEDAGYTVLEASRADDAIRVADRRPGGVHLLVTDVIMPRGSGRALVEVLGARYSGMKVLYMSGYTADAIGHHGVLDAAVHFLPKPFDRDVLLRKVREALDG
jgi:GAF domain-containing protein